MTDVTLQDIAGILGDTQWDTSVTNNLTFSFPTAASNYGDVYGAEDGLGAMANPIWAFSRSPRSSRTLSGMTWV